MRAACASHRGPPHHQWTAASPPTSERGGGASVDLKMCSRLGGGVALHASWGLKMIVIWGSLLGHVALPPDQASHDGLPALDGKASSEVHRDGLTRGGFSALHPLDSPPLKMQETQLKTKSSEL